MTDVPALKEIDNFLRDILGVIGNAFQALRDNHQVKRARDRETSGYAWQAHYRW